MPQIHRLSAPIAQNFMGPDTHEVVTFGYQPQRGCFSLWYRNNGTFPEMTATYLVAPTGQEFPEGFQLVASCVMSDGFTVFHLLRKG